MLTSLIAAAVLSPQAEPVDLSRKFKAGATYSYAVRTHLMAEIRDHETVTFIPTETDINYDFNYTVTELKPSGIATIRYRRPTMDIVEGETAASPAITHREKVNYDLQINLSPVNEITNLKDMGSGKLHLGSVLKARAAVANAAPFVQDIVSQFSGELYRMALFTGSLDSALDFNPRLPFEPVEVGESWKRTVSYQPGELKGSKGEQAVQRLDMEYTYKGKIQKNGKTFDRISATVNLDTDAALFINQMLGMTSNQSGLAKLPLKMDSVIDFDLDPVTHDTVYASARTTGYWSLNVVGVPHAVREEKLTGKATLQLISVK